MAYTNYYIRPQIHKFEVSQLWYRPHSDLVQTPKGYANGVCTESHCSEEENCSLGNLYSYWFLSLLLTQTPSVCILDQINILFKKITWFILNGTLLCPTN